VSAAAATTTTPLAAAVRSETKMKTRSAAAMQPTKSRGFSPHGLCMGQFSAWPHCTLVGCGDVRTPSARRIGCKTAF
jgi:hypothetical protein